MGIDGKLKIFLDEKNAEVSNLEVPEEFIEAVQNIREFISRGGKRLRPILFCCGYTLAGGADKEDVRKAAVSMELLHTGLLIHDDVMDRDDCAMADRQCIPSTKRIMALNFNEAI